MTNEAADQRRRHAHRHRALWLAQGPAWLALFVLAMMLNLRHVPLPDAVDTAVNGPWVAVLSFLALGYIAFASIQAMAQTWHAVEEGATYDQDADGRA